MTKEDISKLLGRPLTPIEDDNFDLYLEIAQGALENLLCFSLDVQEDNAQPTERVFGGREGFRTTYTGIYTDISEVKIDGTPETDYYKSFWDNRNSIFYNSIVFNNHVHNGHCEVSITAKWGFKTLPVDLQLIIAALFDNITKQNKVDRSISSKKVEDFEIRYTDLKESLMNSLKSDYLDTIQKYSMCAVPDVTNGKICWWSHVR